MVELRAITEDNLIECLELTIRPDQTEFVAPNAEILAEAYVLVATDAAQLRPYAIYESNKMVGFVIYGKWANKSEYHLWAIMVDEEFQGRGYGKTAIELVLSEMKLCPFGPANKVTVAYEPENTASKNLFRAFGFVEAATRSDDGEIIAELDL